MCYSAFVALQLLNLLNVISLGRYEQSGVIQEAANKSLNEIFQSWRSENDHFKSYYFDITVAQENATYQVKTMSKCRVALMMRPNGNCLVKMETLTDRNKPTRTTIYCDNTTIMMEYAKKELYVSESLIPNTQQGMAEISNLFFPAVPFFVTGRVELEKRFKLSLLQKDEHYTWIRFEPRTDLQQRDLSIAQLGVVNYANSVSPKHFPLTIQWCEPGGDVFTWSFTQVQKDSPSSVNENTFLIDQEQLKREGWKISKTTHQQLQAKLWWLQVFGFAKVER